MAMDYKKVTDDIIRNVGGTENIVSATHCMTRLRLILKDEAKADDETIKNIKGVKSVVRQGGQYQIIIGNEVSNLFKEFTTRGNFGGADTTEKPKNDEGWFKRVTGFVAGSFIPLLPAMLGCGMIKVVLTLLTTFGLVSTDSSTYILLNGMGDAFFWFFPILLGYTTAKKLGSSPVLSMAIAASWMYPAITTLLTGGGAAGTFLGMSCTYLFGLPVISTTYASSVLPILLMAPVIKRVEEFADRVSPTLIKSFLKPLLTVLICDIIAFVVIGPIGGVIGNYMAMGINWLYAHAGWLTITLIAAFFPFIVMTGMHYALFPIIAISLATFGYDPIGGVTMFCSNLAQGAAALAIATKLRDKEAKSEAFAAGISAVVAGVTEPALYGVTLQHRAATIAVIVGGAVSGLYAGITHLVAYSMSGAWSVLALVVMIGENRMNLINGIITMIISLVVSFATAYILFKDNSKKETQDDTQETEPSSPAKTTAAAAVVMGSPLTGKVVPLSEVPDEVFASGMMGKGVAIEPAIGEVRAPADCKVSLIINSLHAVGLTLDNGAEILVHVGLDTVKLNGKHYECMVKEGERVKAGQVILRFDIDAIRAEGYPVITPVIVTNSNDFNTVSVEQDGQIEAGAPLLKIE